MNSLLCQMSKLLAKWTSLCCLLCLLCTFSACKKKVEHGGKTPLVEVGNVFLYQEDVRKSVPYGLTGADSVAFAKEFAARTGAVVAITGAIDIVADREKAYCIRNGHPMMSAITGTGCQLSGMDQLIADRTGAPCVLADNADSCVAYGCGKSIAWINRMQEGPINIAKRRIMRQK